jgi:type II secretory pathway component PulF
VSGIRTALVELDDGRHRAELYRMWSTAYNAGFTHPQSLETMGPRASPRTEDARRWLLQGTTRGRDVATLARAGGARFDDFERALLVFGDEAGHLDDALRLLGDFYMNKHQLMLWVKKKMAYPFFTALAACFVAPFPLFFFGHTAAYFASAFAGVTALLVFARTILTAVAAHYGRAPALARARMARALATAIQAGLPLPRALRLAAGASSHPGIRRHVHALSEHRLATSSISDSLAGCPHLTPEFGAILATAERTGDFTPLARLAELYEDGFR